MSQRPDNPIVDILTGDEQPPEWLVRDIIAQGSFGCLCGESGAGKSYITYSIGLAVAAGCPALSGLVRPVEPRRVLYFDDENSQQDRDKYLRRAWLGLKTQNRKEPDLSLLYQNFWPLSFQLGHDAWPDTVAEWMAHVRPHLMVFDTANACLNVEDENNNAEAGQAIKRIKALMRLSDPACSAIILKHAKTRTEKGQVRTVRGAKIWKDQSDWFLFQVKAGGRPRKDGLSLTRLIPDKVRAYGLQHPLYITPMWTDKERSGLVLEGSDRPSKEHTKDEMRDDDD